MSQPAGDGNDRKPIAFPPSAFRASDELRLPENAARLKLFRILRKASQNLAAELCPRDPKCICTKARDVVRNLPHWQLQIDSMFISGNGAIDLSIELEACKEVLVVAKAVIAKLEPLIFAGKREDQLAHDNLRILASTVLSALGRINGEFTKGGTLEPKSDPGTKATHTRPKAGDIQ